MEEPSAKGSDATVCPSLICDESSAWKWYPDDRQSCLVLTGGGVGICSVSKVDVATNGVVSRSNQL